MSTAITSSGSSGRSDLPPSDSKDPWKVLGYEVAMYFEMRRLLGDSATLLLSTSVRNALVESHVLHARILCDRFSYEKRREKFGDDVDFTDLFRDPPWDSDSRYDSLKALIPQMRAAYGDTDAPGSPCWQFNKMLAHLTSKRGDRHDYERALKAVEPWIEKIVSALETLKPGPWQ